MSATRAYATVLLAALCYCAAIAVDDTAPSITPTNDTCVTELSLGDGVDVLYDCETDQGEVLWVLNGYQMVDRDEFSHEGVEIIDSMSINMSRLNATPPGINFLFEHLQTDHVAVGCSSVIDSVNVNPAPQILIYTDVTPNLPPPVHEVTECRDDGSYIVDIRYQRVIENCSDIVNYTLSASSGTALNESNCRGAVCVFGPEDDLSMRVIVNNTADYAVTLEVCTATVCRENTTLLTDLTCSQPTWGICSGQANLSCDFPNGTASDWRCNFTSNEAGDIAVVDVFKGRVGGQSTIPSFDSNFNCPDSDGGDSDDSDNGRIIGTTVGGVLGGVLGLLALLGLLSGAVIAAPITYHIRKPPKPAATDKDKEKPAAKNPVPDSPTYEKMQ